MAMPMEVDDVTFVDRCLVPAPPVLVDSNNTGYHQNENESGMAAAAPTPSSWFSFRRSNTTTAHSVAPPSSESASNDNDLEDTTNNNIPEDLLKQVGDMEIEISKSVSTMIYQDQQDPSTTTATTNTGRGDGGDDDIDDIDDGLMDDDPCKILPPFDDNRVVAVTASSTTTSDCWGMVSDNEEDDIDTRFNFVAVSKSLLMEERSSSFEEVVAAAVVQPSSTNRHDVDGDDDTAHRHHHGVLIIDGLINDDDGDNDRTGTGPNVNITSSSATLTIPGSDSLPSDLDTISHQGDADDEYFSGHHHHDEGNHNMAGIYTGSTVAPEERRGTHNNNIRQPLILPFLQKILANNAHRRRNLTEDYHGDDDSDANNSILHDGDDMTSVNNLYDAHENDTDTDTDDGIIGTGRRLVSVVSSRLLSPPSSSTARGNRFSRHRGGERRGRKVSVLKIGVIIVTTLFVVLMSRNVLYKQQRRHEEEWKKWLLQEEKEKDHLRAEKETLLLEKEQLQEEAAVAWARADTLAKDHERMQFLQDDEKKQRNNCRKRQRSRQSRSDYRDNYNFDDWFFTDKKHDKNKNAGCDSDCDDDDTASTSFTFADNCWIKASADIDFGTCGSNTKEFFSDIWDGLWYSTWDDWDTYFDFGGGTGGSNSGAVEPFKFASSSSNNREEEEVGRNKGNQFNRIDDRNRKAQEQNNSSQNQHDEDDDNFSEYDPIAELFSIISSISQSCATKLTQLVSDETNKVVDDIDNFARRGYMDATKNVSDTVRAMEKDIHDVSQKARNNLYDTASNTLSSLSKAWEDTTSLFMFDMDEEDDNSIPPILE